MSNAVTTRKMEGIKIVDITGTLTGEVFLELKSFLEGEKRYINKYYKLAVNLKDSNRLQSFAVGLLANFYHNYIRPIKATLYFFNVDEYVAELLATAKLENLCLGDEKELIDYLQTNLEDKNKLIL
jgi:anti-anti-sigma regulatory factor